MNIFEFIKENFLHVLPILLSGAFAIAIIGERVKALLITYPLKDTQGFFDRIRELIFAGKTAEAVALCDAQKEKPVAMVVKGALLRAHLPENLIEHGIELAVGEASHAIKKRTTFLATIANVATLLGLLGTIAGLIHSFEAVGHADAQQKSALLAAGISSAMNATMMGLGVAIPCMIAFSFLMNVSNRMVSDLEHSGIRIIDLLKQRFYTLEAFESDSASPSASSETASVRRAA